MTSAEIIAALRRHHGQTRDWPLNSEPWALFEEIPVGTAFRMMRRIDLLAISTGSRHERIAYEVKVSRTDLKRELGDPYKRYWAELVAHRWVLAVPPGLVRPGELPEGAGLVEITTRGVRWIEQGTSTPCETPDLFLASIARRGSRAERKLQQLEVTANG